MLSLYGRPFGWSEQYAIKILMIIGEPSDEEIEQYIREASEITGLKFGEIWRRVCCVCRVKNISLLSSTERIRVVFWLMTGMPARAILRLRDDVPMKNADS